MRQIFGAALYAGTASCVRGSEHLVVLHGLVLSFYSEKNAGICTLNDFHCVV
jgi:hypothetical protein